jgi:hypothetical protein
MTLFHVELDELCKRFGVEPEELERIVHVRRIREAQRVQREKEKHGSGGKSKSSSRQISADV